jgi:hypothetical protein
MLFLRIFKVILIDFVTKNKKSTKSTILDYKEYTEYTRKFVLAKKKMYSFVLERVQSGHPVTME